jgi:hypothetical protein
MDFMIKIVNIGSPQMLSRHFKTQDNIFQGTNKANKIPEWNEKRVNKQV